MAENLTTNQGLHGCLDVLLAYNSLRIEMPRYDQKAVRVGLDGLAMEGTPRPTGCVSYMLSLSLRWLSPTLIPQMQLILIYPALHMGTDVSKIIARDMECVG